MNSQIAPIDIRVFCVVGFIDQISPFAVATSVILETIRHASQMARIPGAQRVLESRCIPNQACSEKSSLRTAVKLPCVFSARAASWASEPLLFLAKRIASHCTYDWRTKHILSVQQLRAKAICASIKLWMLCGAQVATQSTLGMVSLRRMPRCRVLASKQALPSSDHPRKRWKR